MLPKILKRHAGREGGGGALCVCRERGSLSLSFSFRCGIRTGFRKRGEIRRARLPGRRVSFRARFLDARGQPLVNKVSGRSPERGTAGWLIYLTARLIDPTRFRARFRPCIQFVLTPPTLFRDSVAYWPTGKNRNARAFTHVRHGAIAVSDNEKLALGGGPP